MGTSVSKWEDDAAAQEAARRAELDKLSPEERKAALDEEDRKRRRAELQQLTAKLAPLIEEVRKEVRALHDEYGCGPLLLRLSWSDAATYERKGGTGGPRAAMRFAEGSEAKDPENRGLEVALELLSGLQAKYCGEGKLSIADLWSLAAATSVEAMGGPHIDWRPGRVDARSEAEAVKERRLPDAAKGAPHLREVFGRMGFNDREIVALSGAHTVGQAHTDRSGYEGPWTPASTKFDNTYYTTLLETDWVPHKTDRGKDQFVDKDTQTLTALPTDLALINDEKFLPIVEEFSKDQAKFFSEFAAAFKKAQELGVPLLRDI